MREANIRAAIVFASLMLAFGSTPEAAAQNSPAPQTVPKTSITHQPAMDVTVVGCVVRERDYRKQHQSGKGGPVATGVGVGNEYVLVNATTLAPGTPPPDRNACSPDTWGDSYELTGGGEGKVKPFVGHWVEITGKQKKAEITKATRGTDHPKPTGGKDPLNQDLRLFEINVNSVRDYVPPVAYVAPPVTEPQAAAPPVAVPETPAPQPEPQPAPTSGRETLPRTASTLPMVALFGAFFVALAFVLHVVRDITGRDQL